MRELDWLEPGDKLDPRELAAAEAKLGVRFPSDYAEIVCAHSGASNPDASMFSYEDRGKKRLGNFGMLLRLRDTESQNVFEAIEDLADQLPARVIPVAGTGSGDFICLDYRNSANPSVVFWNHNRVVAESISPLDSTFASFLARLTVPADDE